MSNSIQEQLLKAGLITEEQLDDVRRKEQRPPRDGKRRGRNDARTDQARPKRKPRRDGDKARPARRPNRPAGEGAAQAAQGARDGKRPVPSDKRRLRQRVRSLLEKRALSAPEGEIPYNFVRGKRVKRLYVDETLRTRLLAGELVIAEVYGLHHIVDADTLRALLELLPETFVHRHGEETPEPAAAPAPDDATPASADDYAAYEVPDDLVW